MTTKQQKHIDINNDNAPVADDGTEGCIEVTGARVNNLKDIDVTIPHQSLTVVTGLSGSGKSSLAFDTIFAEGQRRYIETFSAYARNMLGKLERPEVDHISGLCPVIAIEQKTVNRNPRSTIGTTTEIYDFLRLLFSRAAGQEPQGPLQGALRATHAQGFPQRARRRQTDGNHARHAPRPLPQPQRRACD